MNGFSERIAGVSYSPNGWVLRFFRGGFASSLASPASKKNPNDASLIDARTNLFLWRA